MTDYTLAQLSRTFEMHSVRDHATKRPVHFARDDGTGRLVMVAFGNHLTNEVRIDLEDILSWLQDNKQLLNQERRLAINPPAKIKE